MSIRRALSITLLAVATAAAVCQTPPPLSTVLRMHHGRPTIFLNEEPVVPMIYALTDVPGGRWTWEELPQHNIREFARHGTRLYQVHLFFEQMWQEDGSLDITPARKQIRGVLDACPDAAILMRLQVTAPRWWLRAHPEEWVRYADTGYDEESDIGFPRIIEEDNFPVRRVSMASLPWRTEAGNTLRQFLRLLAATPEGNALAGIQVANGIYGEWHNWGFFRNEPDTSAPMAAAFRVWLKNSYDTEPALRSAWHSTTATFASASVPTIRERETTAGIFRDPVREQKTIDYYTCVHQLVVDNIIYFASIVKESWPRPILTGTFYGYFFSMFGRQAAGGHLELHRLLRSPAIDYLSGPQAYEPDALKLGDPFRSRSLVTTVRLHGKLWLDENDNEPTIPTARDPRHDLYLRNAVANVRRNTVSPYTGGMGLWYYDFGTAGVDLDGFRYNNRGPWGNWDHPVIQENIRLMRKEFEARMATNYTSPADVLLLFDTRSYYHTASLRGTDPVSTALVDYVYLAARRSGLACDVLHINDLPTLDMSRYRTVVFGNVFVLSQQQRDFIRTHVARGGRTLVWFHAPGISDGSSLDPTRISELTGIRIIPASIAGPPAITYALPNDTSGAYTLGDKEISPLFSVQDPDATPFGRFRGTQHVALARKEFPDHSTWYVALPGRTVEPLRSILRSSGAHCYAAQGEIVYAGGGILAIHTATPGTHTIVLRNGSKVSFDLPEGASTLILDAESGAFLLPE
jgi:hypothetical protein